jgi:hypothetical protein
LNQKFPLAFYLIHLFLFKSVFKRVVFIDA